MVKFTCRRCGAAHIAPLEEHDKDRESYGYLYTLKPPKGWGELPYNVLLCPKCTDAYKKFMNNEEAK
jgi:rubredoxin